MSSLKQLKLAEKALAQQRHAIAELQSLIKSIERCERSVTDLKTELEAVNRKHASRRTTEDDIAYLTDLLNCANKKLQWEKQIASLKKRAPVVLNEVSAIMDNTDHPPGDEMRSAIVRTLQGVQAAMARLEQVNIN